MPSSFGARSNLALNTNPDYIGAEMLQKLGIGSMLEQQNYAGYGSQTNLESPIEENIKFGDIDDFTSCFSNNNNDSLFSAIQTQFNNNRQQPPAAENNVPAQMVPGKPFERFNFENLPRFQRTSSYDYSATTASTPSSSEAMKSLNGSPTSEDPGHLNPFFDRQNNFYTNEFANPISTIFEENHPDAGNLHYDNANSMIPINSQALNYFRIQQTIQQLQQFRQLQQLQYSLAKSLQGSAEPSGFERRFHRASDEIHEAAFTWSGSLPVTNHRFVTYSPKVFLGGIPWDISEQTLIQIFKPFGEIRVEWPGKEQNCVQPKGYAHIVFESEKQVKQLLQCCTANGMMEEEFGSYSSSSESSLASGSGLSNNAAANPVANLQQNSAMIAKNTGSYFYKISSKRIKAKVVEVIPWIIGDSNYMKSSSPKYDPTKTVFVGGLHGQLNAEGLAKIMDDLFDGVSYVGIDTDKNKYPIGSGRVTFNNQRSYMTAVAASYIEIRTPKFRKKVQINPYLEDALCSFCDIQHGPYYCRELACFRYYCSKCWKIRHDSDPHLCHHKPMTRNSKSHQIVGVGPQVYNQNSSNNYHHNNTQSTQNSPMMNFQANSISPESQNSMFDFTLK